MQPLNRRLHSRSCAQHPQPSLPPLFSVPPPPTRSVLGRAAARGPKAVSWRHLGALARRGVRVGGGQVQAALEAAALAAEDALWAAGGGGGAGAEPAASGARDARAAEDDEAAWVEAAAAAAADLGGGGEYGGAGPRAEGRRWAGEDSAVAEEEGRGRTGGDAIVERRRALRAKMAAISLP